MNEDSDQLASAYLDGELTADDRAAAEADREVMDDVARFAGVAAGLRSVDGPGRAAAESAVAAALAEFDAAVPSGPGVIRPRPALARVLGIAAAVVVVGALGVVVATGGLGGSDDQDSGAAVEDAATAEDTAEATQAANDGADAGGEGSSMDAAEAAPTDGGRSSQDSGSVGDLEMADDMSEEMSEVLAEAGDAATDESIATAEAPSVTAPPPLGFDPSEPLDTPGDLTAYGEYLLELETLSELPPTPNTNCLPPDPSAPVDILASTTYVLDDESADVLVAVDRESGIVSAIDPDTCEVVADNTAP